MIEGNLKDLTEELDKERFPGNEWDIIGMQIFLGSCKRYPVKNVNLYINGIFSHYFKCVICTTTPPPPPIDVAKKHGIVVIAWKSCFGFLYVTHGGPTGPGDFYKDSSKKPPLRELIEKTYAALSKLEPVVIKRSIYRYEIDWAITRDILKRDKYPFWSIKSKSK